MAIITNNYNYFSFQGPPEYTQSGIFGMKINHLATLPVFASR
jgi:hypothetical protein